MFTFAIVIRLKIALRNTLFLLFLAVFTTNSSAQRKVRDSLYTLIHAGGHDTVMLKWYCELARAYSMSETAKPDTLCNGIIVGKKAKELALKVDNKWYAAEACMHTGNLYYKVNRFDNALTFFIEAVKYAEESKNEKILARAYNNIGLIHTNVTENQIKAREYFLKALEINTRLGNKRQMGGNIGNIGNTYVNENEREISLNYSLQSYQLLCESGDTSRMAIAAGNVAEKLIMLKRYDKAFQYIQLSKYFHEKMGEKGGVTYNNMRLGKLYYYTGDLKQSEKLLLDAFNTAQLNKHLILMSESASYLTKLYVKLKDADNAMKYQNQYYVIKDTLANQERLSKMAEIETANTVEKMERVYDEEKRISTLIQDAENKRKLIIIWSAAVLLIIIGVFAIFIYNRFRVTQQQKAIIEKQKLEVEIKNEIIEEKQKALIDSINYAKRIQDSLLPKEKFILKQINKLKK